MGTRKVIQLLREISSDQSIAPALRRRAKLAVAELELHEELSWDVAIDEMRRRLDDLEEIARKGKSQGG